MKIGIIIAAGGSSNRMTLTKNKLLVVINKVPIIVMTIRKFLSLPYELEIILVCHKEYNLQFKKILDKYELRQVTIINGGKTRRESVHKGILALSDSTNIVAIHDGARPFVRSDDILKCIKEAIEFGGACLGVKSKDTMKIVNDDQIIVKTLNREKIYAIQTPQCFSYNIAKKIHKFGEINQSNATDDAKLSELMNLPIKIVQGHYDNIKITTDEDLNYASWLLNHSNNTKTTNT